MPTAGTHITIIERLALNPRFTPILGDPHADIVDPAGKRMRYARLGAIGPDLFYALLDIGPGLQDLTNFLTKTAGSFQCIADLMSELDSFVSKIEADITLGASVWAKRAVGQFTSVFSLTGAVITEGLMAVVVDRAYNFFPIFEAVRQKDEPRRKWYWADYLHYVRTGVFVKELFELSRNKPHLRAYAYGYLSHYVTDVVGHPFVNQVVEAPWRMYWQRHHLVENFIDAYVWDRWHDAVPSPDPYSSDEPPLDRVRSTPQSGLGRGAPFTFARLNDHIKVGYPAGSDPVDQLIQSICEKIKAGLEDIGVAEPDPVAPNDSDFVEWTRMLAEAFRRAYPEPDAKPPENLKNPPGRPDGYPTADDVASAYTVLRLFLRFGTEEGISEPEFPNVPADVWNAIKRVLDDLRRDLGALTPPPGIGVPVGGLNFENIWKGILAWVKWAAETAVKLGKAALDYVKNALAVGGTLLLDSIKIGLYFVKVALFSIYKAFRHFLVRAGYAIPFTDELVGGLGGGIRGDTLWHTPKTEGLQRFPLEELPELERVRFPNKYPAWVSPTLLPQMRPPNARLFEDPLTWVAPYGQEKPPDAFVDAPLGGRVMLAASGPLSFGELPRPGSVFNPPLDFGGAIANCESAFGAVLEGLAAGTLPAFPDYNLDGDRGYAWPCWDVANPPGGPGANFDPLDPREPNHPLGRRHITVNPVLIV